VIKKIWNNELIKGDYQTIHPITNAMPETLADLKIPNYG